MIRTIVFSENGTFAAFHDGMSAEEGNAWLAVLQDKLDRKTIDLKTKVKMPGWWTPDHQDESWTVGELVKTGHLKIRDS